MQSSSLEPEQVNQGSNMRPKGKWTALWTQFLLQHKGYTSHCFAEDSDADGSVANR